MSAAYTPIPRLEYVARAFSTNANAMPPNLSLTPAAALAAGDVGGGVERGKTFWRRERMKDDAVEYVAACGIELSGADFSVGARKR